MITIVDDDEPGVLSFSEDDFYVTQSGNKQTAVVWVRGGRRLPPSSRTC